MSDNVIIQTPSGDIRRMAVILFVCVSSLSLSVWAGAVLFANGGGGIISVSSPFENGFVNGALMLCIGEIIPIAVFSFSSGYAFRTVFTAAVFAVRGAALGASVIFCIENTASAALLGIILSYAAVTLLTAVYFVLLSWKELSPLYRLLTYLTASGAAIVLRVLPYLLLKQ